MGSQNDVTVLVVDNEPEIVETYSYWLSDNYHIETAHSGKEVMEKLSEEIDVMLLDRMMPGMSGAEVLEKIKDRRDLNCRIAMVTAVSPDFDIISMGFDEYLVKPVDKEKLHRVVENLIERTDYNEKSNQLFSLISKKVVLEQEMGKRELNDSSEYKDLVSRIKELESTMETFMDEMTAKDFKAVLRDIPS